VKIIGAYPTNAVGVLLGLAIAGCADNNPPTGADVAHAIKGTRLPGGLGVVTTGYCRANTGAAGYTCVFRTAQGRATCTTSVDKDGKPKGLYCTKLGV